GDILADFDGPCLPYLDDDRLRLSQPATRPNKWIWRMDTEGDTTAWFNAEVSNVVLAAWADHPSVLQASEKKAPSTQKVSEVVDTTYSIKPDQKERVPITIGEFKRGLIDAREWQSGTLSGAQSNSPENFEGNVLLDDSMPRQRYLTSLFEVCVFPAVPEHRHPVGVGGIRPHGREFFSGVPLWPKEKSSALERQHPQGYYRLADPSCGALYWAFRDGPVTDGNGNRLWDSRKSWESPREILEDELYD
ncbi:hypothetical protein TCAP_02244, partial [Tolypocladium capitatum]